VEQGDLAYKALRQDITEWRLAPGTALGEIELARRLGMSRTPVREALKRLAREGLVRNDAGRTAIVAPLSMDEAIRLFQVREALELYALRLAAVAPDRSPFAEISDRYEKAAQRSEIDVEEVYALSEEFDAAVDDAADNNYLTGMLADLRGHLLRLRRLSRHQPERLRKSAIQHVHMGRALVEGDGAMAAYIGAERLRDSLRTVIEFLGSSLLGPLDEAAAPVTGDTISPIGPVATPADGAAGDPAEEPAAKAQPAKRATRAKRRS
jgi:DNA-binding GntR family transcriptional regulator